MASILDMADLATESESTLNVKASVFVPRAQSSQRASSPQQDINVRGGSHTSPPMTSSWPTTDAPQYEGASYSMQMMLPGSIIPVGNPDASQMMYMPSDFHEAYWNQFLETEDRLRDQLYRPPQQPKGNTYGRARKHPQARGWGY